MTRNKAPIRAERKKMNRINLIKSSLVPDRSLIFDTHQQILDKFFDEFFGNRKFFNVNQATYPKMDIFEDEHYFCIDISVPGIEEKDLDLETIKETRLLTVKGNSRVARENCCFYHMKELKQSAFSRSIQLPENIEIEPEICLLENGILKLSFKKITTKDEDPKETVKKITINKS